MPVYTRSGKEQGRGKIHESFYAYLITTQRPREQNYDGLVFIKNYRWRKSLARRQDDNPALSFFVRGNIILKNLFPKYNRVIFLIALKAFRREQHISSHDTFPFDHKEPREGKGKRYYVLRKPESASVESKRPAGYTPYVLYTKTASLIVYPFSIEEVAK